MPVGTGIVTVTPPGVLTRSFLKDINFIFWARLCRSWPWCFLLLVGIDLAYIIEKVAWRWGEDGVTHDKWSYLGTSHPPQRRVFLL